ncbi:MAG: DUF2189 domain-containing protein [Alphaproteobacteria bacterium]
MDQLKGGTHALERTGHELAHGEAAAPVPKVNQIGLADLRDALAKGAGDLGANRTDVVFLCAIYPVAGLVLAMLASGQELLPLVFPLVSGFALIGPVAAVGLYEISRRREAGQEANLSHALGVVHSPAIGSILGLGLLLLAIFLAWLAAAYVIFLLTLGPEAPASIGTFASDLFTTGAGWAMIVVGVGVGFGFAVLVLAISVVSIPMLLDRHVGIATAIATSVRVVIANPRTMAVWGMIVTGGLVFGSIPALIGLIIVLPVLGHATWHLYRKAVTY